MSAGGILINSVVINTSSGSLLLKAGTSVTDPATVTAVIAAGGVLGALTDPLLLAAQLVVVKKRATQGQDEWLLNAIMGAAYTASMEGGSEPGAVPFRTVNLATAAALATNTYSSSALTLTASANGALTVDGVAVTAGQRILVDQEATAANNGIYVVTQPGSSTTPYVLTRAGDAQVSGDFQQGVPIMVLAGNTQKNWVFQQSTTGVVTVGTTSLAYFPQLQFGTSTLVAGVSPSIVAFITATSKVFCTRAALNSTPALGFLGCDGGADLVAGTPGSFVVRSRTVAAAAATTDVSSFNWYVLTD